MSPLSARHEDFVQAYLDTSSAYVAADVSGVELKPVVEDNSLHYVYFLVRPDTGCVLYVGKGKKNRMHHHMRDFRLGKITASKKNAGLRALASEGVTPEALIFEQGLEETNALRLERSLIAKIGIERLLNAASGSRHTHELCIEKCIDILSRMKPFCRWLEESKPSPKAIGNYAAYVNLVKDDIFWINSLKSNAAPC